jgi:membrane-associated protease RseP (regulator of RpoE activity)
MLGLFYCFLSSLIFIMEIHYLYIVSIKKQILLRFQIILFPKNKFKEKTNGKIRFAKRSDC